jgi:NAD kinase
VWVNRPEIVVVTRPTELASLRERFVTDQQVKFVLKAARVQEIVRRRDRKAGGSPRAAVQVLAKQDLELADAAMADVERTDDNYHRALDQLRHDLAFDEAHVRFLDRAYLPTFDFGRCSVVVVVGQDGLVANTAKYVGELPIVAINPDPSRFDGILLPFQVRQARQIVARVLDGKFRQRQVALGTRRPATPWSLADGVSRSRRAACWFPLGPARPAGSLALSTWPAAWASG